MKKKLKILLLIIGVVVAIVSFSYTNPLSDATSQNENMNQGEKETHSLLDQRTLRNSFINASRLVINKAENFLINDRL